MKITTKLGKTKVEHYEYSIVIKAPKIKLVGDES